MEEGLRGTAQKSMSEKQVQEREEGRSCGWCLRAQRGILQRRLGEWAGPGGEGPCAPCQDAEQGCPPH